MGVNIYTLPRVNNALTAAQLEELLNQFLIYKGGKVATPILFGRDEKFDRPPSIKSSGLAHVHVHPNLLTGQPINSPTNMLKAWRFHSDSFKRTCDTFLIYCQGEKSPSNYLFIAFWRENAHNLANKTTLMLELAEDAEKFRRNY
jgi:mRNA interferase YafO